VSPGSRTQIDCRLHRRARDEAVELVERGFEFVNQIGTVYLYRKRK
jgi:hypothetical protein